MQLKAVQILLGKSLAFEKFGIWMTNKDHITTTNKSSKMFSFEIQKKIIKKHFYLHHLLQVPRNN